MFKVLYNRLFQECSHVMRIEQGEIERCEASKAGLRERLEAELVELRRQLEIQERMVERCEQDKRRLTAELESAWLAANISQTKS